MASAGWSLRLVLALAVAATIWVGATAISARGLGHPVAPAVVRPSAPSGVTAH